MLEGEGRAVERAAQAAAALEILGCDVTLVRTSNPVVDIVPFHLLTLDLAAARGIDLGPDPLGRPALEKGLQRLLLRRASSGGVEPKTVKRCAWRLTSASVSQTIVSSGWPLRTASKR